MTPVVVDASAGAEIVTNTLRGKLLLRLLPPDAELWVPEHFYAEVLAVIRRLALVGHVLNEAQAREATEELAAWRLRHLSIRPFLAAAWSYRHNMSAADAFYVALAEHLSADFLTDDHRLVQAPTFPSAINVLRLDRPSEPR